MGTSLRLLSVWWHSYHWGFGSTERRRSRIGWRTRILIVRAAMLLAVSHFVLPTAWAERHMQLIQWGLLVFALDTLVTFCLVRSVYKLRRAPDTSTGLSVFEWRWWIVELFGYEVYERNGWRILLPLLVPQIPLWLVIHLVVWPLVFLGWLQDQHRSRIRVKYILPAVAEAQSLAAARAKRAAEDVALAMGFLDGNPKARLALNQLRLALVTLTNSYMSAGSSMSELDRVQGEGLIRARRLKEEEAAKKAGDKLADRVRSL